MRYLKLYESFFDRRSINDFLKKNNIKNDATVLECPNNRIVYLSGIENLKNLRILNCHDNKIESLKGIENSITLKRLNFSSNKVKFLNGIENLTNLTELFFENNQIESLKGIENLTNLSALDCSNNRIESLSEIENLTNLGALFCDKNKIKYPIKLPDNNLTIKFVYGKELVEKFKTYEFQKEFLVNNPDKFEALEPFGYAEGIREEFPALFTGKEWGFFDLERGSR